MLAPRVRRRDAATQQGDALEGATLREGYICGRTAIPPNARNTQNIAAEYLLSKTTSIRVGRYGHLRRSIRTSASVDTDVCAGRCGRLRRSIRTSASVDADICVGRRGCSTTNINIRNETSFYHTKLSSAQPLLSANLQRRIHRRVAVGHEAQHQLAEPAALEPERTRLRRQGHHRSLYAAHSKN